MNLHWTRFGGYPFTVNNISLHNEKKFCGDNPKYTSFE